MTYNPAVPGGVTRSIQIRSLEHKHRALELRLEGWNYQNIGVELGIDAVTAQRLVKTAMDELSFENQEMAAELRNLILMRNDKLVETLLPKAVGGDLFAVDRLLKVQEQSARLAGSFPQVERDGGEQFNGPIIVLPAMLEPPPDEGVPMPDVVQGALVTLKSALSAEPEAAYIEVTLEPDR